MTVPSQPRNRGPSPRISALLLCGLGAFAILSYAGVVPWYPPQHCRAIFCSPDHWQILSTGIGFFCAGVGFLIPSGQRALVGINAIVIVCAFTAGIIGSLIAA